MLEWLGVGWDGEPTYQSQRFDSYTAAADRLLADGRAYCCDCTAEEVQARAKERGGPPGYDRHCRDRDVERGPTTEIGRAYARDIVRQDVSLSADAVSFQ